MSDLNELVQAYTVKQDRKIKKICDPLTAIGIPFFGYFHIQPNGCFGTLSNYSEELEFFYQEGFHIEDPYLVHPQLLRPGYAFTPAVYNHSALEKIFERFQMSHLLIVLRRNGENMEGFVFARKGVDASNSAAFYSQLDLLAKFIPYFKQQAKRLIENMMKDGFNIREVKNQSFFNVNHSLPLIKSNPPALKFLELVSPLSCREHQCLDLFKQGHSAQSTAAILKLSHRTVEHYFDNIKWKLNCSSKWELLEW